MSKTRIVIAEDHTIVRDGLVSLLKQQDDFEVTGTASNGLEVLKILDEKAADVCLLDINMPGMDGIQASRIIGEKFPDVKVIILTTYNDKEIIAELVDAGVAGYLLKNSDKEELVEAIHRVMKGRYYFSGEVEKLILLGLTQKKTPEPVTLTEREIEIVQLLSEEFTNDKIATKLNISYRTVETHRKNIMRKTRSGNLAGLIRFAYSKGLLK